MSTTSVSPGANAAISNTKPASQYVCVMFPYPSGEGLHVGHWYNYAITDTYCRWLRSKEIEVFQPFGYDAFGLPAENYARKVGRDPREVTEANIERFRGQMNRMNTQFEERLVTSEPDYTKWTQWVFTLLHERGLAYKAWADVNWCPGCQTVLANEQAQTGACDRCQSLVEQKSMHQWFFKITDYKERLIKNLDTLNWPQKTIKMQRAWLETLRDWCVSRQRSWGCPIPVDGETDTLDTFVDSSFYFLRYCTDSEDEFLPKQDYKPVDTYIGGSEHACMHLIYARFIHMVLFDAGIVPEEEPFRRVIHQGMITKDGAKMSKSKGNVVDPDNYDPDQLRLYLMFMGPYTDGGDWSDQHIKGIERFCRRWTDWVGKAGADGVDMTGKIERLERDVDSHVERWKFNRVVSSMMEFYNAHKNVVMDQPSAHRLIKLTRIFAPGMAFDGLENKRAPKTK